MVAGKQLIAEAGNAETISERVQRAVQITETTIKDAKSKGDQKIYGQSLRRLTALNDLLAIAEALNSQRRLTGLSYRSSYNPVY